jgi:predicted transcriptional regulator
MSVTVTARLAEDIADKLDVLAGQLKRSKSFLVAQAIEDYVAREADFLAKIEEGLADLKAGRARDHAEVMRDMRAFIDSDT